MGFILAECPPPPAHLPALRIVRELDRLAIKEAMPNMRHGPKPPTPRRPYAALPTCKFRLARHQGAASPDAAQSCRLFSCKDTQQKFFVFGGYRLRWRRDCLYLPHIPSKNVMQRNAVWAPVRLPIMQYECCVFNRDVLHYAVWHVWFVPGRHDARDFRSAHAINHIPNGPLYYVIRWGLAAECVVHGTLWQGSPVCVSQHSPASHRKSPSASLVSMPYTSRRTARKLLRSSGVSMPYQTAAPSMSLTVCPCPAQRRMSLISPASARAIFVMVTSNGCIANTFSVLKRPT